MVEELLTKNSVKFSDINAVGVVVGPGSFTGIRIGIAYAKGIGLALGIPVIPINRLEVALRDSPDSIIAIDDKKGGWFAQSRTMPASAIQSVDGNVIYNPELDIDTAFEIMEEKINAANPVIPLYLKPHYAEKK
jgi:tRNA threonylcarbamoyl adenosine modification protein YeaZ